jgi:hypothetical protein
MLRLQPSREKLYSSCSVQGPFNDYVHFGQCKHLDLDPDPQPECGSNLYRFGFGSDLDDGLGSGSCGMVLDKNQYFVCVPFFGIF